MLKKWMVGEVVFPQIGEINEMQKNAGEIHALMRQGFLSRLPHLTREVA
jgi:hypothetical protein